jgi:hypothetical protein
MPKKTWTKQAHMLHNAKEGSSIRIMHRYTTATTIFSTDWPKCFSIAAYRENRMKGSYASEKLDTTGPDPSVTRKMSVSRI